jgi:hypothetical protein
MKRKLVPGDVIKYYYLFDDGKPRYGIILKSSEVSKTPNRERVWSWSSSASSEHYMRYTIFSLSARNTFYLFADEVEKVE